MPFDHLVQDLRDAVRALRATPLVSAIAILSLGLGIGANTALFSVADALILRPLPVDDPGRLALLCSDGQRRTAWTNPIWEQIRDRPKLFPGAFATSNTRFNLSPAGESQFVEGLWASGNAFDVLGVQPLVGRLFTAQDDRPGGGVDGPVAVISHAFWQRRFGGSSDAIGKPPHDRTGRFHHHRRRARGVLRRRGWKDVRRGAADRDGDPGSESGRAAAAIVVVAAHHDPAPAGADSRRGDGAAARAPAEHPGSDAPG